MCGCLVHPHIIRSGPPPGPPPNTHHIRPAHHLPAVRTVGNMGAYILRISTNSTPGDRRRAPAALQSLIMPGQPHRRRSYSTTPCRPPPRPKMSCHTYRRSFQLSKGVIASVWNIRRQNSNGHFAVVGRLWRQKDDHADPAVGVIAGDSDQRRRLGLIEN